MQTMNFTTVKSVDMLIWYSKFCELSVTQEVLQSRLKGLVLKIKAGALHLLR